MLSTSWSSVSTDHSSVDSTDESLLFTPSQLSPVNGRTACLCSASTERACASFSRGHSTLNEASQKVFAPNKTKIITIPHLSGITTCICHYDLHRFPDSILLRH
ncbi:hypothetical protein VTP01DRAFT_586 [Rhizomucor pusillus]|uniref:uncharacterized protein n=1 Tax=Rhizomucor pusillus TaxID=4840 RepID=UPI003742ED2E